MKIKTCMVHGRFQPFTIHHMHYVKKALKDYEDRNLIIAITNPTIETSGLSEGDDHRHLQQANPYNFEQRKKMIEASLLLDGDVISKKHNIEIIPFPINTIMDQIKSRKEITATQARQIIKQQTVDTMKIFMYTEEKIKRIEKLLEDKELIQYMIISDGWGLAKRKMFESADFIVDVIKYPRITSGSAVRYLQENNDEIWTKLVPKGTEIVINEINKEKKEMDIGEK